MILLVLIVFAVQLVWLKLLAGNQWNRYISAKKTDLLFCLFLALTIGTLMRQYPWTSLPTQTDSSVFLYIGRQMHRGKVPYIDLFDHKGPILYLIQYLGYTIWPGSVTGGVWLLELLSMGILIWLILRLSELVSDDRRDGYLTCILLLIICAFKLYQGGNYTEEYALPWMCASLLVFFSFFRTGRFTKWQIILLGLSCCMVLLMQENLITVWVALVPVVVIRLIHEKRFREIWECILLFLLGMLIVMIPVLIWAWASGCLEEMWKYFVVFNFSYSASSDPTLMDYLVLTKKTLNRIWPGTLALLISLIGNRKDKLQWINLWLFVVSLVLVEVTGRDSLYYLLTVLPALVLPSAGMFAIVRNLFGKRVDRDGSRAVILLTCFALTVGAVGHRALSSRKERYQDGIAPYLVEQTTEEDDVLIIGNFVWPYLAADRETENRFFFQWPPIRVSDELYEEFLSDLQNRPSDVIILAEHENGLLKIPGEGKIDGALELLLEWGYQKEQYDGFSVYLSPEKAAEGQGENVESNSQ